jgi:hypothetical protein
MARTVYVHSYRQFAQGRVLNHNGDLGYDYDECVDVPNGWAMFAGFNESYGNANSLKFRPDAVWIPNTPTGVPAPGDIVIWTAYPADPLYGHVAVALHGCTEQQVRALSQNFPDGSPCECKLFTYQGVAGWWHVEKAGLHIA